MVKLGTSKVPLDKDIFVEKPREFFKSWAEFATDNFEQVIIGSFELVAGDQEIFTVPKGKIFYLVDAHLTCINNVAGASRASLYVIDEDKAIIESILKSLNDSTSNNENFIMPIRLDENQIVGAVMGANMNCFIGFRGFLVDKNISP